MNKYKVFVLLVTLGLSRICFPAQIEQEASIAPSNKDVERTVPIQFYGTTSRYLWLDKQQLTNQAYDALDFISTASIHGLFPDDYHYTTLRQLTPPQDEDTAQRFDVLLTDGLLSLIHDLAVGRFNPIEADPHWFIPAKTFDAADFLQQALLSKHLKTVLQSLIPTSADYHKLTEAATRYQSYVDRGGWRKIPSTQLLHPGDVHPHIPAIRTRLAFEDKDLVLTVDNHSTRYDSSLVHAVRRFQKTHSLKIDGIIGEDTLREMNVSASTRLKQIKINLERRRWLPRTLGQRYVLINLASYKLFAIDNDTKKLDMRVIIGREKRPTPSFASELNHLVINPFWNVPKKLARLDLLPKQQANPDYFHLQAIRVFSKKNGRRIEHDPYLIDWQSVSRRHFPYILRQDPGEHNALGRFKFMFPNQWDIYLHDTPDKQLFNESKRSLSSGCIRVEDPEALANFTMPVDRSGKSIEELINSKQNLGRRLADPLSIYAVYFTVWLDNNQLLFSPDIYQRDQRMTKLL
ncbi:MAG: L,D-transpeptidase family protein [Gammaproteobacteria bacterium]|nr:L,D-transpeptidase family protein [Gammaproteobacteria bacterium]